MAPKWGKKAAAEPEPDKVHMKDAALKVVDQIHEEDNGGDLRDLVQEMLLKKKEEEEFVPTKQWNKGPRAGSKESPAEPQAKAKAWGKKKEPDKDTENAEAKAAPAKGGWKKKAEETPAESTDTAAPKAKAKAWGKKKNDAEGGEADGAEDSSKAGAKPKAKAWGKAKKQEPTSEEPAGADVEAGAKAKAKAKGKFGSKKGADEKGADENVTPPQPDKSEADSKSVVPERTANKFYYGILVSTTLEKCIAKGKWESKPYKVDKPGVPEKGDRRVCEEEIPGLGNVLGTEVCTGYYENDNEYFLSYALIESSLFTCTPFLGTLHMMRVTGNPNKVFLRFRATWDGGELTLLNQDLLKQRIDQIGDDTIQAPVAEVEGRIDPSDGKIYTLEELRTRDAKRKSPQEIDEYWLTMIPEGRIDPADGATYTLQELRTRYARRSTRYAAKSTQEIDEYWRTMAPEGTPEKRIDPADGATYTLLELRTRYATTKSTQEIDEYWRTMTPEGRIDPADGVTYTLQELRTRYAIRKSPQEIDEYWSTMTPAGPPEKRIDPADGATYTLHQVRTRYSTIKTPQEIDEHWRTMTPAGTEEKRIDPVDGATYTLQELQTRYATTKSTQEIDAYWRWMPPAVTMEFLGGGTRLSWASRLKAAALEIDPDGSSPGGPKGQDTTQGADLGLATPDTTLDFLDMISPAQKRWADLRTMIKLERSTFFDTVIRSDLKDVLQSIDEDELCEVRSYARPPLLVEHVLANVQVLLGLPEDWDSIRRNMRPISGYLQQLMDFSHSVISLRGLQQMRKRAKRYPASFKPHIVETISGACAALCRWVNVMCWRAGEQNWFHEDVELLADLDKEMICELASFNRPPAIVAAVLGNVHVLLGLDDSWPKVQGHLKSSSIFLQRLQYFDQTTLTRDVKDIMQERHMMYPYSFVPDMVQPVNSACAKLCKWVNAVCLRAGLDFTSERRFGQSGFSASQRAKFGQSGGLSAYSTGAATMPRTPDDRRAHEETSGWTECIHIDSKFIRPEDHTKTLEQLFTPKPGAAAASQLQMGAAKWFLDPSGERNFRYAPHASQRFDRARSTPVVDNRRSRSPLSGSRGLGNRPNRSPSARAPSVSPRQGGLSSVSPRPQAKTKPSQAATMRKQPQQRNNPQLHPKTRSQPTAVQDTARNRSTPQNTADKNSAIVNENADANATVRKASKSRRGNWSTSQLSPLSPATPSAGSSASPFIGEAAEGTHPDSYLLSSLGGPAVVSTIAGVLKRPPKNPEMVALVLGNVHCLLGLDPDWEAVLESLQKFEQLLDKMKNLDPSSITPSILDALQERRKQNPGSFEDSALAGISHACAVFAQWINAVIARASSLDPSTSLGEGHRSSKIPLASTEQTADLSIEGVGEVGQSKEEVGIEQGIGPSQERDGKTDAPSSSEKNDDLAF